MRLTWWLTILALGGSVTGAMTVPSASASQGWNRMETPVLVAMTVSTPEATSKSDWLLAQSEGEEKKEDGEKSSDEK